MTINAGIRYDVMVERLKAGSVRTAIVALDEAYLKVRSILGELPDSVTPRNLNSVLAKIRKQVTPELYAMVEKHTKYLKDFYADKITFEQAFLRSLTPEAEKLLKKVQADFPKLLKSPVPATGELLQDFLDDLPPRIVKRINNGVRRGFINGLTNQQIIADIIGSRSNPGGGLLTSRRDVETVVRTSIQHASSQARLVTLAANSDLFPKYVFIATLDLKTTRPCKDLDQTVHKVGEGPVTPLHLRCRSTMVPHVGNIKRRAVRGPSGKTSFIDGNTSYYDWLKDQPSWFQDEAIGPTRAKLLRTGKLTTEQFAAASTVNLKPTTLAEMRELQPKLFE